MTPLAEILKPHMSLIVGALVFMFGLAIFVGVLMVLRRLWSRELGPGERIQDPEQLAAELHEEIIRLEELRDRLDPSYSLLGHDVSARPIKKKLASQEAEEEPGAELESELAAVPGKTARSDDEELGGEVLPKTNAASDKPSEDYIKVAIKQATAELNKEITELNAQVKKMKAEAASVVAGEADGASADEVMAGGAVTDEKLAREVIELKTKLEDYQAFEDELALVKTYKEELEKLKARIAEMETGQPQITDDDIASLFAEMGDSIDDEDGDGNGEGLDSLEDLLASDEENSDEHLLVPAEQEEVEETQVFKASPKEPAAEATVFSEDDDDVNEPELVASAPSPHVDDADLKVGEDTAEAYAELGEEGDELLAEFEKVLSSKEENP